MHTYIRIVVMWLYALIYSIIRANSKVLITRLNNNQLINDNLTIETLCNLVSCVHVRQLISYLKVRNSIGHWFQ
jgi:hypothetical protein